MIEGDSSRGGSGRGASRAPGAGTIAGFVSVVVGIALFQAGCPEPFEPYWSVDKFRVLGVKTEPATLRPGEAAEVSVLEYVPPGAEVSYEWSWCPVDPPAQQRYECPLAELAEEGGESSSDAGVERADLGADSGGGAPAIDPSFFELGTGPTASMPYPGTREQVLEFCRQLQQAVAGGGGGLGGTLPTSDCRRGLDIAVRLEARTDGGAREIAKKKLTLWTGGDQSNSNPDHRGIEIRVAEVTDISKARRRLEWVPPADRERSEQWYVLPEEERTPILAGMTFDLRARVGSESSEEWRPPPPRGSERRPPLQREPLTFRWFVSGGTVEDAQRIYLPKTNRISEIRRNQMTIDELPEPTCAAGGGESSECRHYLWSVVRDDRGGLDWSEGRFRVVGPAKSNE